MWEERAPEQQVASHITVVYLGFIGTFGMPLADIMPSMHTVHCTATLQSASRRLHSSILPDMSSTDH